MAVPTRVSEGSHDQCSPAEWNVSMCPSKRTRSRSCSRSPVRPRPSDDGDTTKGRPPDPARGSRPPPPHDSMCMNENLCGGLDQLRSLQPMLPPTSSSLVMPPGVSLLQPNVGVPGLGVGLGGVVGMGAGGPGLGMEVPEQGLMSVEEAAAGVQMGIKVRGLDLMRYGRLEDGVYKCTECERIHIPKTFKTSYSFQRHAYLYHEGRPKRFPCPVCGKEFSRPDKRKSHLKEKHGLFQPDPPDLSDFQPTL
ncbi:hypothetical protein Pcinc_011736 [Petrolisthes cinctipes]|uniref:C2H2-type domain-containing protein n=1 Tax=Petrolisthes cinctipes TaxID=88211 RepID=A0AAE1G0E9_PETCI|nr:hypothetical protein Pcinc_011736 [Petrolisthes cinctipes]